MNSSFWQALAVLLILLPCLATATATATALNSDGLLLLSFKSSVLGDPLSVLGDWNADDGQTPCSWNGVTCTTLLNANATTNPRVIGLLLPNAQLLGSVPPELGLLEHLRHLDLSGNFLNGTLPTSLFNASDLRILSLANNEISGELPEPVLGRLSNLQELDLSDNALGGGVPGNLSLLPNLTILSLANNYLSGRLPSSGFRRVEILDLSSNLINGTLPRDLAGRGLRYLNLSDNKLAGEIPAELGTMIPPNATLDLSNNNLTGQIPESAAFLTQKSISFAGNPDLCGRPLRTLCAIPSTLSDPTPPNATSSAPLEPKSPPALAVMPENPKDSPDTAAAGGRRPPVPAAGMKPAAILAIIFGDVGGIGLLVIVFLYLYQAKKRKQKQQQTGSKGGAGPTNTEKGGKDKISSCCFKKKGTDSEETTESSASSETEAEEEEEEQKQANVPGGSGGKPESQQKNQGTLVTVDGETELEVESMLKASAYILGATGSSIVYKAVLADGTALAVRRIGEGGPFDKLKEFEAQVRGIARFHHPNLLCIRGFYWGADEKLLIHDYAPNGSLANISFARKLGSSPFHLSWEARLGIARGVARGLAYLHEKKCVHGNIKPSNILLSNDMEPWIGDFGLERLMLGETSSKSARHFGSKRSCQSLPELLPSDSAATLGVATYQAPESLKSLKPSARWDVYSYGTVLLELLAGRLFSEAELFQWNAGFVVEERNRVLRMADPSLRNEVGGKEEALLICFKLGFACAAISPQRRPSMKDVCQVLDKIPSASSS